MNDLISLGGPKMILSSGIACGVLLGVIEGVGVLMQRMFAEGNRKLASLFSSCTSHRTDVLFVCFLAGPVAPMVSLSSLVRFDGR